MTTGERIRRAIKRKFGGLKQGAVAERLGVPAGNLSEWLSNQHEPSLSSLRKIADRLSCSVNSLIGDEGKPS